MLAASERRVLWLVPAFYFLLVTGEFMAAIHMTIDLTERGASAFAVGLLSSAFWVGLLVSGRVTHRVIERLGRSRALKCAAVVSLGALSLSLAGDAAGLWMAAMMLLGLSGAVLWVGGETWLAEAAPPERRGLYVGLFETTVGLGMVAGPLLARWCYAVEREPLPGAVGLLALGAAVTMLLPRSGAQAYHDDSAQGGDWRGIAVPLAAMAVLSGMLESGSSGILPSVALRVGLGAEPAALLGAVIGAGSALMQAPAGLVSDGFGYRRAVIGAWAVLLVVTVAFWVFSGAPQAALWPLGFVLGGVGGAVYTLTVISLGHQLAGSALVRAMGMLVVAYTVGTAVGPSALGFIFDTGGTPAIGLALVALSALGLGQALRVGASLAGAGARG